jgi:hypothetical protein
MRLTPLESDIQKAIIDAFKLKHRIDLYPIDAGGKGFRSSAGSKGHSGIPEGFPDLLGFVAPQGRGLLIEVKRPRQKPKPKQVEFMAGLAWLGTITFWADSVTSALDQFEQAMRRTA